MSHPWLLSTSKRSPTPGGRAELNRYRSIAVQSYTLPAAVCRRNCCYVNRPAADSAKLDRGQLRPFDSRRDLREGEFPRRGRVVGERREPTVVRRAHPRG